MARVSDERLARTISAEERKENRQTNIGSDMLDLVLDLRDERQANERLRAAVKLLRNQLRVCTACETADAECFSLCEKCREGSLRVYASTADLGGT